MTPSPNPMNSPQFTPQIPMPVKQDQIRIKPENSFSVYICNYPPTILDKVTNTLILY